jgi:hypothetical protein
MILVSVFRDSLGYLQRYADQVAALREHIPVQVVSVEGDSIDASYTTLKAHAAQMGSWTVLKAEHGGPKFPSIDSPQRWRQMAAVCNLAMTAASRLAGDDPVIYVESDLVWAPETMLRLLKDLTVYPAVAPMSLDASRPYWRFYDTFGYRKRGIEFADTNPPFPGFSTDSMHQIDSCGSCWAMRAEVARAYTFSPTDCIVGGGKSIYDAGYSLWLNPTVSVRHP